MEVRAGSRRLVVLLAAGAATLVPLAAHAATAKVEPVAAGDPRGDVRGHGLDISRVQLGRASDGRLRGAITLAKPFRPKDLLASSGPPGSLCLRLWTLTRPVGIPPDFLVCITADPKGRLRGTVSAEQVDAQPRRIGPARVSRASSRTLVVKFSRSAVGRPEKTVAVAAEATRPGCSRPSCVDVAPDAPRTMTLKLR
jgi:hypothetical protein